METRGETMGLWLLTDKDAGRTVMYDSVTETPFGPGFYSREEAEDFGNWLDETHGIDDARRLSPDDLTAKYSDWHDASHDGWGNFRATVKVDDS
jgi:hypothetical protein